MSISSDLKLIGDMAYRLSIRLDSPAYAVAYPANVYTRLNHLRKLVEELERASIRELNRKIDSLTYCKEEEYVSVLPSPGEHDSYDRLSETHKHNLRYGNPT